MARNKKNRLNDEPNEAIFRESVANEVTKIENQYEVEAPQQEEEVDGQPMTEPDMEVTVTTAEVKEDGSVELAEEPIELEALEGSEMMPPGFAEFVSTVKSMSEPKELRKADPAVVAKSKENQAKKHIADNPFGKKVKPEIYKVKHNKNDERLTDTDLIGNVVML